MFFFFYNLVILNSLKNANKLKHKLKSDFIALLENLYNCYEKLVIEASKIVKKKKKLNKKTITKKKFF